MGRDKVFKCAYCGKYISYNDIARDGKIKSSYIPETPHTQEKIEYWHIECRQKSN